MREKSGLLDHVADAAAQRDGIPFESASSFHTYFAVVRFDEAIDQLERSGFSGSAAAQKNQGVAKRDGEVHVFQ